MKVKTYKYLVREGCHSIWKQKLMSIATVSIIVASFIVLGVFLFFVLNVNTLMNVVSEEPDLLVICELKLSNEEVESVKTKLEENPQLSSIEMISVEEGLKQIKDDMFAEHPELFKTIEEDKDSVVPVKFNVKMLNPQNSNDVINEVEKIKGVKDAESPSDIVNFILGARRWINIISLILLIILSAISVLIVSNAIKLTVHARRREIGIMKCVGATNAFIRGPFIVEGVILGLSGSVISYIIAGSLYTSLVDQIALSDTTSILDLNFVHLGEHIDLNMFAIHMSDVHVGVLMGCVFLLLGLIMGILGSVISIRKYLDV